jgi:DNA-binding MarR family transcriptional regulator
MSNRAEADADGPALARPIGWWLKEADARLDAAFDRALEGVDVDRRTWQVLASLSRHPDSESGLAAALAAFDPPAVIHQVVADLEQRGWVVAAPEGLRLTEAGSRQYQAIAPMVEQVRRRVGQALPDADYLSLVRLLRRLTEAL